jgi:protein transport protein SEC61 subunit alpha
MSQTTSKFLRFFSPFVRVMPEIKQPDREVSFKEKIMWTAIALIIYMVMSVIPLYGVDIQETQDYFYWLRVILASQRGTLTELGIGPIVTAGLIMQLLMGSGIIKVNLADPYDRSMFTGAQKVLAVFLTIFNTVAYLIGGAFGEITSLPPASVIFIFLQLLFSGIIIILLDEMLQKGWGIGSGVSLFIATNIAGQIFWNCFSLIPVTIEGRNMGPRGIVFAFFDALLNPDSTLTLAELWNRPSNLPGLLSIITTVVIFIVVVYFESVNVDIPLAYSGYRGFKGKYPIKLLYVSNIPVILVSALYANIIFLGQIIAGPNSALRGGVIPDFLLNLIATYSAENPTGTSAGGNYLNPIGGILYFMTPPTGLLSVINDPLRALIYLGIFIVFCVVFGRVWVEVSGLAPRDIARQILDSGMEIPGFRRSERIVERILARYIPTLTILCGLIVGLLSFASDALGALTSGTGLLIAIGIIHQYAESISKEAAAEQYPALRGFLGLD